MSTVYEEQVRELVEKGELLPPPLTDDNEPDLPAQYEAQHVEAEDRLPIIHNEGSSRGALEDVTRKLSKATSPETKIKLADVQKKIGASVDKLLSNLPKKIAKANLAETVSALTKLVPLMSEIDTLLIPQKTPQEILEDIRKRAQKKIAHRTRTKANGSDTPAN